MAFLFLKYDNSFAAGGVLIKTEILSFVLKQKPSTPANLMMEVRTIWELCLFLVGPSSHFRGWKWGYLFLTERDWSRNSCYGNSSKGVISFLLWCTFMMPSFKNTASIFPEISFIHHWSNLHNRKMSISLKRKNIFQKEKRHSSVFWNAFPHHLQRFPGFILVFS